MNFRITGERLEGFAEQARRLGNVNGELTPAQMVEVLQGVTTGGGIPANAKLYYTGSAYSEFTVNFESNATGVPGEISAPKCYYNNMLLPGIPAEMLERYPYVWIRKTAAADAYDLYFSAKPWHFKNGRMTYTGMGETSGAVAYKVPISTAADTAAWVFVESAFYVGMNISDAMPVAWSNYDVPNGSADATEIYFAGSAPVPAE